MVQNTPDFDIQCLMIFSYSITDYRQYSEPRKPAPSLGKMINFVLP